MKIVCYDKRATCTCVVRGCRVDSGICITFVIYKNVGILTLIVIMHHICIQYYIIFDCYIVTITMDTESRTTGSFDCVVFS